MQSYLANPRQPAEEFPPAQPTHERGGEASRRWKRGRVLSLALIAFSVLGSILLVLQLMPPAETPGAAIDFYHDFRGRTLPPELKLLPEKKGNLVRFEPEGLRITVQQSSTPQEGNGVLASMTLRGDFEVTATVEVLQLVKPPSGTGAGAGLYLGTATAGANLRRFVGAQGRNKVIGNHHFLVPGKQSPTWEQNGGLCDESVVRLRFRAWGPCSTFIGRRRQTPASSRKSSSANSVMPTSNVFVCRLGLGTVRGDGIWTLVSSTCEFAVASLCPWKHHPHRYQESCWRWASAW